MDRGMFHLEFHFKNKFENSVQLFGFIIRIYHGVQSSERLIRKVM